MNLHPHHSIVFVAASGLTAGCSSGRTADSLARGETAVVHLSLQSDGSAEATSIEVENNGENDGVDCEQQGEHEGDNEGCLRHPPRR